MSELLQDAARLQRVAADPQMSVWVAASAGTGKTKVLTDRVLCLLLAGTAPHRILCLTFTKAAAAEMSNRIASRLGKWATQGDDALTAELTDLLGHPPHADQMITARRLFARVLDCPGGLRMETIHAFCQSLLRRFPLEAGLAPHFRVMDDRQSSQLLTEARDDVLAAANDGGGGALAAALACITGLIHETAFPELMGELTGDRGRLHRLLRQHGGVDGAMAATRRILGLDDADSVETVLTHLCDDANFAAADCRRAANTLSGGKKTDTDAAAHMLPWLAAGLVERRETFADYCLGLLTAKNTPRAKLPTKDVAGANPWISQVLQTESDRLIRGLDRLNAARIADATQAVLVLAQSLLEAYDARKQAHALMDYDDLILAARDLLSQPGVAPWVLFKLDGGLDHVLIDEAQDTNPDQWAVVAALTAEFFAGEGASDHIRTVFAVGDAKQSIYSFQRADPREFDSMRRRYADVVPQAGQQWRVIPLNLSFRSTQAVLDAVNRVFADGQPGRDGVAGPEDITHLAFRAGQAGLVELWPPVLPQPLDTPEPWKPPIERISGDSASTRLARLIAKRIRVMIDTDTLPSQGRPVRPGDIMVLMRRRDAFVDDLVRELKAQSVPVAGADRMVLADQMAVMDLTALGHCLLLPQDDLTLAAVLKGPLIGWDEETLFQLAWNRGAVSLWDTLRQRRGENPAFAQAWDRLTHLQSLSQRLTPHAFYAHILGPLGGKRQLLARLGQDAEDPLDEFIALTLAYQRTEAPSLQGFLHWLDSSAVEIKRDLDQGGLDAVRIMTVHGSKGLQAPIVFLPDTMQVPRKSPRLLWIDDCLLWPYRSDVQDTISQAGREQQKIAQDQEYRRLLYVAMTRAEDRLIICGRQGRTAPPAHCWYSLIHDALEPTAERVEDSFLAQQDQTDGHTILRLSCAQTAAPRPIGHSAHRQTSDSLPLPPWADQEPPPEPAPPRPLAPSRPEDEEPPARSPLNAQDQGHRFQRGKLIHTLLQTLPDVPTADRSRAMMRYLAKSAPDLDAGERLLIAQEVAAILDNPQFAPLFAPGSRAEIPIVGLIGENRVLSGQVDRLVVTDQDVLVVDYKTNRRPPQNTADIPPLYVQQMAAYRLALACIYPKHRIRCALVWTDGPRLMEIPPASMDDCLGV